MNTERQKECNRLTRKFKNPTVRGILYGIYIRLCNREDDPINGFTERAVEDSTHDLNLLASFNAQQEEIERFRGALEFYASAEYAIGNVADLALRNKPKKI